MNNADMPAMPRAEAKSHITSLAKDSTGLTKLEYLAGLAIQMANGEGQLSAGDDYPIRENVSANAVAYAGALLDELERTKSSAQSLDMYSFIERLVDDSQLDLGWREEAEDLLAAARRKGHD